MKINENIFNFDEEAIKRANENCVSLQSIEKIYSNNEKVVCNFNLDIKPKDFIVIVGPSGCGKSTTLRMISGLEDITSGNLFIDGEFANFKPSRDRKMAMVFQSYALYPQMTVYDNIAFPLRINKFKTIKKDKKYHALSTINDLLSKDKVNETFKVIENSFNSKSTRMSQKEFILSSFEIDGKTYKELSKCGLLSKNFDKTAIESIIKTNQKNIEDIKDSYKEKNIDINEKGELSYNNEPIYVYEKIEKHEIEKRVFNAAEILDLGPYLDRLPKELSGGQMQRVALGRAIVKNVSLFLMDEPLSNLDAKLRLTMRNEIVKLHNNLNATVVYVTHDQTEAMTMASRVVVMSKGFIQQVDTPEVIYNNPKNMFVANFIGSPTINFFNVNYRSGNILIDETTKISQGKEFIKIHDDFYNGQLEIVNNEIHLLQEKQTWEKTEEFIKKIESSLIDNKVAKKIKRKSSLLKIKKNKINIEEKISSAENKLNSLRNSLENCLKNDHDMVIAIRPERIQVTKEKNIKGKNLIMVTTKTTICELLGADYYIHFNIFNRDVIAKTSVATHYQTGDEITVYFNVDDLLVFDKITGLRIK